MIETDLREADLSGADLNGANLRLAKLDGATVTPEQWIVARELTGASLPDGSVAE
jgi:uncharacterized protein YjbI with pentapeptide repeats